MKIAFTLNGEAREVDAAPAIRLLDLLRKDMGVTGTKEGCGEGECGTCTVLLDDVPVNACMVLAGQLEGRSVVTVEGLAKREGGVRHLQPIQQAFIEEGGAQCGICTPGMLIAADALLKRDANPSDAAIREALAGNICRCTGYQRIVESVKAAAEQLRASSQTEVSS